MALTKVNRGGLNTGISDSSDATFLTVTSGEGATFAGTLAVTGVHTVGTNAVATSDGGAATTSIVQGLAKVWFNMGSDFALDDSLNTASVTDDGTGIMTVNYTNNMNNGEYSPVSGGTGGGRNTTFVWVETTGVATNKSEASMGTCANGGTVSLSDQDNALSIHGDLA